MFAHLIFCRKLRALWIVTVLLPPWLCACTVIFPGDSGKVDAQNRSSVASSQDANSTDASAASTLAPVTSRFPFSVVGRWDETDSKGIRFRFGGLKMNVAFTGTSLAADITDTGTDYFNVIVDGNVMPTMVLNANDRTRHTVVSNLAAGPHVASLVKRTEALSGFAPQTGIVQLQNFIVDAGAQLLDPPALQKRRIEAIGDSGFTGWGVETVVMDTAHDCDGNNGSIEDSQKSIPAQAALALGADIINLSVSGAGVVESVINLDPNFTLPITSVETLPPNALLTYAFPADEQVDVVLLSAGGDDLFGAYGSGASRDPNKLLATYTMWLQSIRQKRPHALIVNCISQSAADQDKITLRNLYTQAIAAAAGPSGDSNMVVYDYFLGSPYQTYNDVASASALKLYWGCEGHPSYAGAQWLGNRLADFVRTKMAW